MQQLATLHQQQISSGSMPSLPQSSNSSTLQKQQQQHAQLVEMQQRERLRLLQQQYAQMSTGLKGNPLQVCCFKKN
jgi:hypothetical protein